MARSRQRSSSHFPFLLLHSKSHDSCDEVEGKRTIQRELHRSLGKAQIPEFPVKGCDAAGGGVEPDVAGVWLEIDQVAMPGEAGHAIAQFFLGHRRGGANGVVELAQKGLDLGAAGVDV